MNEVTITRSLFEVLYGICFQALEDAKAKREEMFDEPGYYDDEDIEEQDLWIKRVERAYAVMGTFSFPPISHNGERKGLSAM